jgi:hypothetical protein
VVSLRNGLATKAEATALTMGTGRRDPLHTQKGRLEVSLFEDSRGTSRRDSQLQPTNTSCSRCYVLSPWSRELEADLYYVSDWF